MFKSSIKGNNIKETADALTVMVDEAKFNITPDGISIKAVDPANVAMVVLMLGKEAFESLDATEGVIGIDLTKLSSFIEMAEGDELVSLELDEQNHKLKIGLRGLAYTMSLLDPESIRKEPKTPEIDLPVNISISGMDFKYGMKAAVLVGDYVHFGMNEKAVTFSMSASGDTDDMVYEIPQERLKITKASDAKSMFATEYLTDIQKLAEKTGEISIKLGTDYPVKIGFPIADGKGAVEYMIAPRVESGD